MKNVTYIYAGAGSGKTYKLTEILSEELKKQEGVKPSEVILTTFTEMAAAEFREKSRQRLYDDGHPDIANQLDAATIGTVHSVAFSFIKKYWYLAGITPDAKVMSEDDMQIYISQSLGDYVTDTDLEFFREYCDYFHLRGSDNSTIEYNFWTSGLVDIINKINTYKVDIDESRQQSIALIKRLFPNTYTPLKKDLFSNFATILEQNKDGYASNPKKEAEKLINGLRTPLISYAILSDLFKEGDAQPPIGQENRNIIIAKMGENSFNEMISNVELFLFSYKDGNEETPGYLLQKMVETIFGIAAKWKKGFEEFKNSRHIIDYNDMERLFLTLLKKEQVKKEIEGTYKLLMVDEFQDSSPIQLEIFQLLSDMMKESYWVGDPKQSIYGFRGTDVSLVNELVSLFNKDDYKKDHQLEIRNLGKSFRSRPSLVELTNDCFIRAFKPAMSPKDIRLDPNRDENDDNQLNAPLSHWNCYVPSKNATYSFYDKVADQIALMMTDKPKVVDKDSMVPRDLRYGDIAILCRTNIECSKYAKSLSKRGIPVSYVNDEISQQIEVRLVISLLQLTVDESNKHIRADLLRLLKDQKTAEILNRRLNYLYQQNKELEAKEETEQETSEEKKLSDNWLDDDSLILQLKAFVKASRHFSVSDMVENIIYGLSLPDVVAKWGEKEERQQNLSTICALAKQYDSHCQQMGIGASVGGFISYLSYAKLEPKVDNSANAIKVLTYHKAKGLEWNYVILDSLSDNSLEDKVFARDSFWGIREIRKVSDQLLNYDYIIQYLPRINSTNNTNIPSPLLAKCINEKTWTTLKEREKRELCHLLYVGVTRARDYLTTLSKQTSKKNLPELSWIKNTGISNGNLNDKASNLWGYNKLLPVYEDITNCTPADQTKASKYNYYEHPELTLSEREPKYLSPSKLPEIEVAQENIKILANLNCRIEPYRTKTENQAAAGTCIHNIFAVYDPSLSHEENMEKATSIRNGNLMYEIIPDTEKVIISIEKLFAWLKETYGEAAAVKHEVPFIQSLPGQVVHGEIDLLWYLNDRECVLIDFKNFPGTKTSIMTPGNEHYAGSYASQLMAYKDVLESSGLIVKDTLVYYSVMGCVVKLNL